ncbi:hypothetical protein IFM89_004181 [Coptis chinensis]|uniref:Cytochrome P450 n=1 Tax=Coptis chinensis TaxID=261450 RepID=A0A835LLD8_9MAGN|nr:hypothetical protein IFM89_004181 [Coptis chinensis]
MGVLAFEIFFSIALFVFLSLFIHVYKVVVWQPKVLRSELEKQGIRGPPPSFLYGNIQDMKRIQSTVSKAWSEKRVPHEYIWRIFPYFELWKKEYGSIFVYSTGNIQNVCVLDPVMVKEISLYTSLDLGKPAFLQKERWPLFGRGILTSNGTIWAHQRKIIAPQLYMNRVKGMVNLMVNSTISLIEVWESRLESEEGIGEIKVDEDLRKFSADVISKACFGSSYSKGKQIFQKLRGLQKGMSKQGILLGVPGLRYSFLHSHLSVIS